jgi:hypothetical protein
MILSNCNYQKDNATEPWVCPPTARGFIQSDPTSLWSKKYKTRETMVVNWFNSTGIEFSRVEVSWIDWLLYHILFLQLNQRPVSMLQETEQTHVQKIEIQHCSR